jgi:hypothetical protein
VAELIAADLFAFGGTGCYGEHLLDGRPNGWVHDPAAWLLARSLMAMELNASLELSQRAQSSQPAATPSALDFAHQLDWRRHVEGVRRVSTCVDGIRMRMTNNTDRPVSIRASVTTFNATREVYTGRLSFAEVPKEWQPGEAPAPVENLAPAHTTLRQVEVLASSIPTNVDGIMNLKLYVRPRDGALVEIPARLCALTAQRFARPVFLDGKLDEWPRATNNAAGDFILVGALDVPKAHRASPDRTSQPTFVYAGRDNHDLFIAFNCQDDHLDERIVTQSNQVSYDDLWPTGEDVLEIVLDPTGQAVQPQDLLHVAVKANGAVITERGAPCLARIGGHGDWAGGVVAAVDNNSQPGRWMAEIRIPLTSLGKIAPVWGINFARYNARLGEYATWSGARRYLYSPVSLGNIQLAP